MDFSVVGSLTKFSGRYDENVRTFTQMIECAVLALGLDTDKKQLASLRLNLLDEAGDYYDDWLARETIRQETLAPARSTTATSDDSATVGETRVVVVTLKDALKALVEKYDNAIYRSQYRMALTILRQDPMETGEAYIARFQDIYRKAYPEDKLTSSQKLDYLLQGLETDTARMVRIQNPTNYREAVSLISRADDASSRIAGVKLREGRPPKKNPIATAGMQTNPKHNNPKFNYNRNKYANNNKFTNNNNQHSASQSSHPPQFQCYNCHQWGHRVMECPQEKKFCSYCKRYGHLQTNCWKLLRQQQVIPRVGNKRPVAQTVSRTVSKPAPKQDSNKATINMIEQEAVRDNQEITVDDLPQDYWQTYQPIGTIADQISSNSISTIPTEENDNIEESNSALTVKGSFNDITVSDIVIDTGAVQSIVQYDWLIKMIGKDVPIQRVANPNLTSVKGDSLEVLGQIKAAKERRLAKKAKDEPTESKPRWK